MKRCWIYCGVRPHTSLAEMGRHRDFLKQYSDEEGYTIVTFIPILYKQMVLYQY